MDSICEEEGGDSVTSSQPHDVTAVMYPLRDPRFAAMSTRSVSLDPNSVRVTNDGGREEHFAGVTSRRGSAGRRRAFRGRLWSLCQRY